MNQEIFKIAKSMKRPIIHVNGNYMLGTDLDFCTLSMIILDTGIMRPFTASINECLATDSQIEKFSIGHPDVFFAEYEMISPGFYINFWNEPYLYNNIFELYRKVNLYKKCQIIYTECGLEKDPEFMSTVAKLKVSDGLTRFTLGGKYIITNFNKVHCINASDKVSVNIYDLDPYTFMCEFIIDKKKYSVYEYIRYRKML